MSRRVTLQDSQTSAIIHKEYDARVIAIKIVKPEKAFSIKMT
jgi:hypothetical protein